MEVKVLFKLYLRNTHTHHYHDDHHSGLSVCFTSSKIIGFWRGGLFRGWGCFGRLCVRSGVGVFFLGGLYLFLFIVVLGPFSVSDKYFIPFASKF